MLVKDIYQVVEQDFQQVNQLILEQLSSDVPLVVKIGQHIIESGGKRMRPLLVLLASKSLSYDKQDHALLAAIIEFLHTATLLHDDVVDTSDLRRGKATANAKWGNAPSVLVGDFLHSRAFEMMVELTPALSKKKPFVYMAITPAWRFSWLMTYWIMWVTQKS